MIDWKHIKSLRALYKGGIDSQRFADVIFDLADILDMPTPTALINKLKDADIDSVMQANRAERALATVERDIKVGTTNTIMLQSHVADVISAVILAVPSARDGLRAFKEEALRTIKKLMQSR